MDQDAVENLVKKILSEQLSICAEWVFSLEDKDCDEDTNGNPFIELIKYNRKHFNQLLRERDEKIKLLDERVKMQSYIIETLKIQQEKLSIEIDNNEQYTRRNMLTLKGIPIKKNEKSDQLLDRILYDIEKLKLEIEDFEVDRVHRNGPKYKDKDGNLQQDIIVKFTSWQARNAFYNARQKTRHRVCPNLTKRCSNLLKYAETSVADPDNQLR